MRKNFRAGCVAAVRPRSLTLYEGCVMVWQTNTSGTFVGNHSTAKRNWKSTPERNIARKCSPTKGEIKFSKHVRMGLASTVLMNQFPPKAETVVDTDRRTRAVTDGSSLFTLRFRGFVLEDTDAVLGLGYLPISNKTSRLKRKTETQHVQNSSHVRSIVRTRDYRTRKNRG